MSSCHLNLIPGTVRHPCPSITVNTALISAVIFDHDTSNISRLYRALECQHHLVQERNDERPEIPGLTPVGFERWVTLLIQANPNQEYERLQKAVLDMPISNPDDKKERFPKDISRRLFPTIDDRKIQERFERAVEEHANINLPKNPSSEPPPTVTSNHSETSADAGPSFVSSNLERERKPYSTIPSESAIDDTNPVQSPPSLERERKPYSAQPGGGKLYEETLKVANTKSARSDSFTSNKPRPVTASTGVGRSGDLPLPDYHVNQRASSNVRRQRSPSFVSPANDFRRSDGDLFGYQSSTYQTPSVLGMDGLDDESRRFARDGEMKGPDWARRQADEDTRGYDSPRDRLRYGRAGELGGLPRGYMNEEEYYRGGGSGRGQGSGYDYSQSHGGPTYR